MAQKVKDGSATQFNLAQAPKPTKMWQERINFTKLPSDLHIIIMANASQYTHTHTAHTPPRFVQQNDYKEL